MSTFTKSAIAFGVVAGIFGLVAFFGYSPFIKTVLNLGASPQGASFTTGKIAAVSALLTLPGANATSSSIQNNSGVDQYITGVMIGCENLGTSRVAYTGGGLATDGLQLSIATTSTAAPATNGTNLVFPAIGISTTTGYFTLASSTGSLATTSVSGSIGYTGSQSVNNIWKSGSYLTFSVNATNTAQCTFGVSVLSS